jgi:hypothetical protein
MKVSGSYATVHRGVSQQIPEARLDGQHGEQVNMLSDPVAGLARRRGTDHLIDIPILVNPAADDKADLRSFVTRGFKISTTEYDLLYRKAARPAGASTAPLYCFNKATNTNVPVEYDSADTDVLSIINGGVSGVAQIGRIMVIAGKAHVPAGASTDVFTPVSNRRYGSIWVKGGAYSRTYTVVITRNGTITTITYTTPSSSYQGTLTTSDIPSGATDYQKQVNDRVNAYNSAVTAWLGSAAAATQPQAVAEQLRTLIAAQGITVTRNGSHLFIDDATLTGITVNDNGDGTFLRAAHQSVVEASQLTNMHYVGKIIKVQAKDNDPAYFLKAVARVPGTTGYTDVVWEEAASHSFTPGVWFALGTVEDEHFYIASTPEKLRTLVPSLTIPDLGGRTVGDLDTNRAPYFINNPITYVGNFQDRLVVGSGSVISMSEVGEYFNFFRTSVLTVVDTDPVEVFSTGAENDIIRNSVLFDKSLLLFGDKAQYSISGRNPVTPATISVIQSSSHEDTTTAEPVASGDLVFYMKEREGVSQVYQLTIGDVSDTSNSSELTQQLYDYIPGTPLEFIATTSPNMLLARTDDNYNTIYTFRYIDSLGGRERLLDSWSRWEFDEMLGDLIGFSVYRGQVLLYWARTAVDASGVTRTWISVDRASLLPKLDAKPYVDSARPYSAVMNGNASRSWHAGTAVHTAYKRGTDAYLQGDAVLANVPSMMSEFPNVPESDLVCGAPFSSYIEMTNPFMRDEKGNVVVTGYLTCTRVTIAYVDTARLEATTTTEFSSDIALSFNSRILGDITNVVGKQAVHKGSVPVFIGREVRAYTLKIASKEWYPMTLTSLEWTGQYFYNSKRV